MRAPARVPDFRTRTCAHRPPLPARSPPTPPSSALTTRAAPLCRRPGEAPRHFECGHCLHADCFAVYVASANSGHTCPTCALDHRASSRRASRGDDASSDEGARGGGGGVGADDDYDDDDDYAGGSGYGYRDEGEEGEEEDDEYGSGGFTEMQVLDALALARRPGDEVDDENEEEADAREELELQAALQLSVRRE